MEGVSVSRSRDEFDVALEDQLLDRLADVLGLSAHGVGDGVLARIAVLFEPSRHTFHEPGWSEASPAAFVWTGVGLGDNAPLDLSGGWIALEVEESERRAWMP